MKTPIQILILLLLMAATGCRSNALSEQDHLIINVFLRDRTVEAISNHPEHTSISTKGSCHSLGGSKLTLRYEDGKESDYVLRQDYDVKLDLVVSHAKGAHVYGTSEANMDYTIVLHGVHNNHILHMKPWIKKINLWKRVKQYDKDALAIEK